MNATQRKRLLKLAAALAKVSRELTDLHAAIIAGEVPKTKAQEKGFTFVGKGSTALRQRALHSGWNLYAYSGPNLTDNWHGDSPGKRYFIKKAT